MKMDTTFDPQTLADDLDEVGRIYARFFSALDDASWDKPVKGGPREWTLHETVAHLCALNGDGLESIKHALQGEPYIFSGLDSRYEFNAFNRKGIDEHLAIPMKALCARLLEILDEAARIARSLRPDQAELATQMPIYNRPVRMVEALSIICVHTGLFHSAQVAEPPGRAAAVAAALTRDPPSDGRADDACFQPAVPPGYWRLAAYYACLSCRRSRRGRMVCGPGPRSCHVGRRRRWHIPGW